MKHYYKNYRIKKITKPDKKVWYQPQAKFLWFWYNIDQFYDTIHWTQESIRRHILDKKKSVIEYMEYFDYIDDEKKKMP